MARFNIVKTGCDKSNNNLNKKTSKLNKVIYLKAFVRVFQDSSIRDSTIGKKVERKII